MLCIINPMPQSGGFMQWCCMFVCLSPETRAHGHVQPQLYWSSQASAQLMAVGAYCVGHAACYCAHA